MAVPQIKRAADGHNVMAAIEEHTKTLPVPPSANQYWQYTGRVFTSQRAKAYKEQIAYMMRRNKIDGPVALNLTVFRPRKSGDLDNYLKIMLDALQGYLYENDSQIVEIHAYRQDDKDNPRVELTAYSPDEHEFETEDN